MVTAGDYIVKQYEVPHKHYLPLPGLSINESPSVILTPLGRQIFLLSLLLRLSYDVY